MSAAAAESRLSGLHGGAPVSQTVIMPGRGHRISRPPLLAVGAGSRIEIVRARREGGGASRYPPSPFDGCGSPAVRARRGAVRRGGREARFRTGEPGGATFL